MNKKAFVYFDDIIWLFRDLTRERPKSLFDHFYLKYFKEAHDKYGFKVQMNVFYRTDYFYGMDEFNLSEMTDAYKNEFRENSDWLKFGFHALQEFPDYPLINSRYEDVKKEFEMIRREVIRFAGEESFSYGVCSHWRPISREGCLALADGGIKIINATGGEVREYTGDPSTLPYGHALRLLNNRQPETKIFTRISRDAAISNSLCGFNHITTEQLEETRCNLGAVWNDEVKVWFKQLLSHGRMLNLSRMEDIDEEYGEMIGDEFISFASHEQYFYPDYLAYQPDLGEKLLKVCKMFADNGYEFLFPTDMIKDKA